jgi:DNA-binding MarR family transcriptional regulator
MLTADPDITRLLDRLETRALIVRERSTEDRRVVVTRIGKDGVDLLKKLDKPLLEQIESLVGHISEAEQKRLIETLESIRRA